MIEELKPCKDCKSPASSTIFMDFYKRYYIRCSGCTATSKRSYTLKEAMDNWNEFMSTNLSPSDAKHRAYEAEIEALKKAIVKVSNYSERLEYENASLKQQLSVALEALNQIANSNHPYDYFTKHTAQKTIQQIQGIDNTK